MIFSSPGVAVGGKAVAIPARLVLENAKKLRPEQVVDTTGAGDAFIAAILTGEAVVTGRSSVTRRSQHGVTIGFSLH